MIQILFAATEINLTRKMTRSIKSKCPPTIEMGETYWIIAPFSRVFPGENKTNFASGLNLVHVFNHLTNINLHLGARRIKRQLTNVTANYSRKNLKYFYDGMYNVWTQIFASALFVKILENFRKKDVIVLENSLHLPPLKPSIILRTKLLPARSRLQMLKIPRFL